MLPSRAYPRRRWGLKERLLAPIVLLVLLAAFLLVVVGDALAQQQADLVLRVHAGGVVDSIANRVEERQRAQATLVRALARQPDLMLAIASGDTTRAASLARGAEFGLDHVMAFGRDGQLMTPIAAPLDTALQPLVASALAGESDTLVLVVPEGLMIGAATPVVDRAAVAGALVATSLLDRAELEALQSGANQFGLVFVDNGRLVGVWGAEDAQRQAVVDGLARAENLDGIDQRLRAVGGAIDEDVTLLVLAPTERIDAAVRRRVTMLLLCAAATAGLVMLTGLILTRTVADPIKRMVAITNEMRRGNYRQRVAPSAIRELDEMGAAVNHMAEQVESQLAELHHQAFHDALTGLPNRVLFMDRLRHALAGTRRLQTQIAVMFIDLDNFKIINDSMGHDCGDRLLIAVTERLRTCLRPADTIARLGGDEFTLLIEQVRDAHEVVGVAERVSTSLAAPFYLNGHEVFVTCSIGIAISSPEYEEPSNLLGDADVAMYQAKHSGKAIYKVFDRRMNAHARERLELATDLRHALERGELELTYQPVVDLETGHVRELEALARWHHPKRGLLSPADFIPLAEETGLSVPIGQWVLAEACRQACHWQTWRPPGAPLPVSVNLSGRQFQQPMLVHDVTLLLEETGLASSCLTLEINETAMMQEAESTAETLLQLKALGVHIAMDDFGTGYSSLAYLKRFPIDSLKVDNSFVAGLGRDAEDTAIVRTIVTLAKTLGLQVTGEGIETEEQAAHLRALGCDRGQGYYYALPLSPGEAFALLANSQGEPVLEPRRSTGRGRRLALPVTGPLG